jgi:hypothetical protein
MRRYHHDIYAQSLQFCGCFETSMVGGVVHNHNWTNSFILWFFLFTSSNSFHELNDTLWACSIFRELKMYQWFLVDCNHTVDPEICIVSDDSPSLPYRRPSIETELLGRNSEFIKTYNSIALSDEMLLCM